MKHVKIVFNFDVDNNESPELLELKNDILSGKFQKEINQGYNKISDFKPKRFNATIEIKEKNNQKYNDLFERMRQSHRETALAISIREGKPFCNCVNENLELI